MPRDGLMTVGDRVIEACFASQCTKHEIDLCLSDILDELAAEGARIVRAPQLAQDVIHNGKLNNREKKVNGVGDHHEWAIDNSRPAFDCAYIVRCGTALVRQPSNVTNMAGVD